MSTTIIRAKLSRRDEVEWFIRQIPAILSGRIADRFGITNGLRMRMAFMFFSLVKEAYIVKSRGGTDEAGIRWPPLSQAYLAYGRPVTGRNPPRAGGLAPGGNDGFMTPADLLRWKRTYGIMLGRLVAAGVGFAEAKTRAAAGAWAQAKRAGVRTKWEVFGRRTDVEILRDRGILFNSLSPGMLVENGPEASYQATEGQIVENGTSSLTVGTSVSYARYHHFGKRPLWPRGELPESWWIQIIEVGMAGLIEIFQENRRYA